MQVVPFGLLVWFYPTKIRTCPDGRVVGGVRQRLLDLLVPGSADQSEVDPMG